MRGLPGFLAALLGWVWCVHARETTYFAVTPDHLAGACGGAPLDSCEVSLAAVAAREATAQRGALALGEPAPLHVPVLDGEALYGAGAVHVVADHPDGVFVRGTVQLKHLEWRSGVLRRYPDGRRSILSADCIRIGGARGASTLDATVTKCASAASVCNVVTGLTMVCTDAIMIAREMVISPQHHLCLLHSALNEKTYMNVLKMHQQTRVSAVPPPTADAPLRIVNVGGMEFTSDGGGVSTCAPGNVPAPPHQQSVDADNFRGDCDVVFPCIDATVAVAVSLSGGMANAIRIGASFVVRFENNVNATSKNVYVERGGALLLDGPVKFGWGNEFYLQDDARIVVGKAGEKFVSSFRENTFGNDNTGSALKNSQVSFCAPTEFLFNNKFNQQGPEARVVLGSHIHFGDGFNDFPSMIVKEATVALVGSAATLSIDPAATEKPTLQFLGPVVWHIDDFKFIEPLQPPRPPREVHFGDGLTIKSRPNASRCDAANSMEWFAGNWMLILKGPVSVVPIGGAGQPGWVMVPYAVSVKASITLHTAACFTAGGDWNVDSSQPVVRKSDDTVARGLGLAGIHTVTVDEDAAEGVVPDFTAPGMDEFLLLEEGTLELKQAFVLHGKDTIRVDHGAMIVVRQGGTELVGDTAVGGEILIDVPVPDVPYDDVPSSFHVRGDLALDGTMHASIAYSCVAPIVVDGTMLVTANGQLTCPARAEGVEAKAVLQTSGQKVPYYTAGRLEFKALRPPDLEGCVPSGELTTEITGTQVVLLYTHDKDGLVQQVLVGVLVCAVTGAMLLKMMWAQWRADGYSVAVKVPPVHLRLTWSEFRHIRSNYHAIALALYEALLFVAVANHPDLPRPPYFMALGEFLYSWVLLRGLDGVEFYVLYFVLGSLVLFWALLWLPFTPYLVRIAPKYDWLYTVHRYATAYGSFLAIPALLILTAPLDCKYSPQWGLSLMRSAPTTVCWNDSHHGDLVIFSFFTLALLPVVVFSGTSNLAYPFGHSPYRTQLDVRYKRSYEAARNFLLQCEALAVAVLADNAVLLLVVSWVILALFLALFTYRYPCAYYNINRIRAAIVGAAFWMVTTSLLTVLSYGYPYVLVPCERYAVWVIALDVIGVGLVCAWYHCYVARRCVVTNDPSDPFATACESVQSMLLQHQSKLKELKHETWRGGSETVDGTSFAGQQSGLLSVGTARNATVTELQQKNRRFIDDLQRFRTLKENFCLPFYLGQPIPPDTLIEMTASIKTFYATAKGAVGPFDLEMERVLCQPSDEDDNVTGWTRGQLLGRGSYGSVYTGILLSGRLLAVKIVNLDPKASEVQTEVERVRREVDFIKHLKHPNIIAYKACIVDHDSMNINIFMEYAVGGSLASLVKKCPEGLSESTIRVYMAQILAGLTYLHDNNVLHRDIKGDNVLLDAAGIVKLADFGCAREWEGDLMGCATFVGSPYWMAPEVIMKTGYNAKADVWSVGCTAVEVLNRGGLPWKDFGTVMAAMYHIHHSGEQPNNQPTDISILCRMFLNQCFERDVSKRPSAKELVKHPWVCSIDLEEACGSPGGASNVGKERQGTAGAKYEDFVGTLESEPPGLEDTISTVMSAPMDGPDNALLTIMTDTDWVVDRPDPDVSNAAPDSTPSSTLVNKSSVSAANGRRTLGVGRGSDITGRRVPSGRSAERPDRTRSVRQGNGNNASLAIPSPLSRPAPSKPSTSPTARTRRNKNGLLCI